MDNDQSNPPQPDTDSNARLDELGRRAGAAYRKDAPEASLAEFERRRQRQRNLRAGLGAGTVGALAVAGILVFVNRDSSTIDSIGSGGPVTTIAGPPASASTDATATVVVTTSTTVPASTVPPTSVPVVQPGAQWLADYAGATLGQASGVPIKVGWANVESVGGDLLQAVGVRAAVEFANAELGGIGGRPIELVECPVVDDASATKCGEAMAADDLLAVLSSNMTDQAFLSKLPADTPHLVSFHANPLNLPTAPGVSFHVDGTTQFLNVVSFVAKSLDPAPRSIALLTSNAGGAAQGAVPFAGSSQVIPVEIGADMTTDELVAAIESSPGATTADAVLIYGIAPGTCTNLRDALQRLGANPIVVAADLCLMDPATQDNLRRAGVTAPIPENWYMFSQGWDPTGENDTGYDASVEAFGRHSSQAAQAGVHGDNDGFAAVLTLIKLVNGFGGPESATRAELQAAMTSFAGPMLSQFGPISCGNVQPWGASAPIACAGYIGVFHVVNGEWVAIANGTNAKLGGINGIENVG